MNSDRDNITIGTDGSVAYISIEDSSVDVQDGEKYIEFSVKLSRTYITPVKVNYSTEDGTATSVNLGKDQQDFEKTSGELTFAPGETSKIVRVKVFGEDAVTHKQFENFAKDTAYKRRKTWKIEDDIDVLPTPDVNGREEDWGYRVAQIFEDTEETGFYAVGLTSDETFTVKLENPVNAILSQSKSQARGTIKDLNKAPVLAVRGTNNFLGILDDGDPRGVGTTQFNANKEDVVNWLKDVGNTVNPHITGHSLGGALAQRFANSYSGQLGEVVTFNSPGIPKKETKSKNFEKATHYITSGDIVSMSGGAFLSGTYTLSSYLGGALSPLAIPSELSKHSVAVIDDFIYPGSSPKPSDKSPSFFKQEKSLEVKHLNSKFFSYRDPDYWKFQVLAAPILTPYLSAALTFRGTTELNRKLLGSLLNILLKPPIVISKEAKAAGEAAKEWGGKAWDAIENQAKKILDIKENSEASNVNYSNITELNNQSNGLPFASNLNDLKQSLQLVKNQLQEFAQNPNLEAQINLAFESSWNTEEFQKIKQQWLNGRFTELLNIEVVPTSEIGGVNGAFDIGNKIIYVASEYVAQNINNPEAIADVLLEEIGHYVDTQINEDDAPGDEGEIFAALVQNQQLTPEQIQALKEEDDIVFADADSIENDPNKVENFWEAIAYWTPEAWDATTNWSDEAWEAIDEWTPEIWEATTNWTAEEWNSPFFAISNAMEEEGNKLNFTVSLSNSSTEKIIVEYTTVDDTAVAGKDYVSANGSLEFAPGETVKTIDVEILQDSEIEETEKLFLNLTNPSNAKLTDAQSVGIIFENKILNNPPNIDDVTFTIDENSDSGAQVGITTATDPEDETLTFAIANGNIDPDTDSNLAFAIDPSTGTITVNDKDDLDFEATPTFNLEVTATDAGDLSDTANITVKLNDVPPAQFDTVQSQNGFFTLNGGDPTNIKFTLANNNTENVNEVGVFVVDDENGSVDGNAPGFDGYLQAALQRSKVIFSAISDRPSGFNLGDIERVLEVDSDARLGFYLVSNGTTDTALAELEAKGTTNLPIFFSDSSNLQVSDLLEEGFNLNWSDEAGSSDFTNLDLSVKLTQEISAPATKLQGNPENELIDLSNETGQVSVSVEIHREAAFDNLIGFYQVLDTNGGIDTNGDGIADFNPGDTGYEEAALTNRITGLDLLKTDNQQTSTFDGTFDGGTILASFMVVDGTVDEAINNNAEVYFSFLGANSDGVDHIRLLGDNTFGYEDLAGGGDFDYNDMIVKFELTTV